VKRSSRRKPKPEEKEASSKEEKRLKKLRQPL